MSANTTGSLRSGYILPQVGRAVGEVEGADLRARLVTLTCAWERVLASVPMARAERVETLKDAYKRT